MKRHSVRVVAWSAVAFVATIIVISLLAAMANQVMSSWGKVYATGDLARLPQVEVALVLGTLPYDPPGRLNPWMSRRLAAAVELWRANYHAGKRPREQGGVRCCRDIRLAFRS